MKERKYKYPTETSMDPAELFMDAKKRLTYRFKQWLKHKAYVATTVVTNTTQMELIGIRIRLHEQRLLLGIDTPG